MGNLKLEKCRWIVKSTHSYYNKTLFVLFRIIIYNCTLSVCWCCVGCVANRIWYRATRSCKYYNIMLNLYVDNRIFLLSTYKFNIILLYLQLLVVLYQILLSTYKFNIILLYLQLLVALYQILLSTYKFNIILL
jgi:hypothetical protein